MWCVCVRGEPPPLYIGVWRGHPEGIFLERTPHRQPPLNDRTASRSWPHLAERRARPCPGRAHAWVSLAPSSFVWLASGWAWAAVLGWGWTVSALVGLSLLFLLCAFQKSAFLTCFTCFRLCFCIHINSTGTSGNRSEAHVYVCINVYFPPFWAYVGGKNLSIMTANS